MIRRLFVAIAAVLLAAQVVRNAAANALAETSPDAAARFWADHPLVSVSRDMTAIAESTRLGRTVDEALIQNVVEVSRKAPLLPEPYLVRGVDSQLSGDLQLAERAFLEAKWRDGRSRAARYFLAEQYFRRGDSRRGLREVAVLARIVPNGIRNLAPYVASYARNRANWPQVRGLFAEQPLLADATLNILAGDPANVDAVLALGHPSSAGPEGWFPNLIATMVKAGQYERARSVWARSAGVRGGDALIFDPGFTERGPLPPFNWSLASSTVGLADRQPGGGLHVIYYGQEDGPLASQLLLLKPGSYRFSARATGAALNDDLLQWRLVCAPTNAQLAAIPLRVAAAGWRFEVPANCPAQRLELFGVSSDVSRQTEARIARVGLMQERTRG